MEQQIQTAASWDKVAHELAESPEDIAGPRLCRALRQRFTQPEDLAAAIQEFWHLPSSLFSGLRDHPSQEVQAALCRQENGLASFQASDAKAAHECAEMSLPELVDQADDAAANVRALTQAAENQVKPHDAPWLWQALDLAQPSRCRVILAALQQIVDETMLPNLLPLADQIQETKDRVRFQPQLTRLFLRLPSRVTLPLARVWIHDDSPLRQRIAQSLLASHADESDLPLLRKLLAKGLQNQDEDAYLICDCLKACTRFPNIGVIDEVARAYTELRYDYGRKLAVKALSVLSPETFREQYAEDCLFDSNEEVRELAASPEISPAV